LSDSPHSIAKHGGHLLARSSDPEVLEGEAFRGRLVIIEFPSMEAARAFYYSPEYQQAKAIRTPVSDARFVVAASVGAIL
jgi:uncharacterized protein (DUF1330 family)